MKKILWLCNVPFSNEKLKQSGGWLQPLAESVVATGKIEIGVVAIGNVSTTTRSDCGNIKQWLIPRGRIIHNQVPSQKTCIIVQSIEKEFIPDLVHVWGTESIWAYICKAGYISSKSLIDIQGLLYDITDFFYGQLAFNEVLKSVHLKEILMPWRTLIQKRKEFQMRGDIERKCLAEFDYISTQSQWVRDHLRFEFPNAHYYNTKIMLRKVFYESQQWQYKKCGDSPIIFTSCSAAVTYKGMHSAIKTIAVLKKKYPKVQLRVAGSVNVGNRLLDGYSIFLKNLIKKLDLKDNVAYLGSLSDVEIVQNLQNSHICLIPSYIETYCLALAESMMVGVPTVVSYAGAMPEQAIDGIEALYYNPVDHVSAAAKIDRLLSDKNMATSISKAARKRKFIDNDIESVVKTQLDIYADILEE